MSNRRPEVPDDIKEKIDASLADARAAHQAGDKVGCSRLLEKAWSLIPDPKSEWDYYPESITGSLIKIYVELNDVENVKKWISIDYDVYDDLERENPFILMLEGESLYKLGLSDEAYPVFERVVELYGQEVFRGEYLEYLEFYLKEKAKRDG